MDKDLTVIITLYETPLEKLKLLNQYKNYKILIFDQSKKNNLNEISKNFDGQFEYFHSKNIGLSKSTNFLISKVKTKYFLFTQADIIIENFSIINLVKAMDKEKDIIISGPIFNNQNTKIADLDNKHEIKNELNASILMCDTQKVKKIGFFDEDFFLYWEDKDLMQRIKKTNYKMIQVFNAYAIHQGEQSTLDNMKIKFIRRINFKYGEFLFDYKHKKLRKIKVFRQLLQNIILFPLNVITLNKNKVVENISQLIGISKFIKIFFFKIIKDK